MKQRKSVGSNRTFSRIRQKYCSGTCLKFIYLACATIVSASFIIECILLHLIITPYMSESVFESGVCYCYYKAPGRRMKCENKCSKDRSSFPCASVQVLYIPLVDEEVDISKVISFIKTRNIDASRFLKVRESRILFLYDYYSTYSSYRPDKVSISILFATTMCIEKKLEVTAFIYLELFLYAFIHEFLLFLSYNHFNMHVSA